MFGIWWVSAIEIKDFWWVVGMWVTGFQGSFGGDGGGGGGGSFCWWWVVGVGDSCGG